jgi:hypothetical protein
VLAQWVILVGFTLKGFYHDLGHRHVSTRMLWRS